MYSGGGDFTTNIDVYGGKGTANFVSDAIEIYCDNAEKNRGFIYVGLMAFGGIAPTYHIELLERPTIVWDFHSLLLGVQMMFLLCLQMKSPY